MKWPEPRKGIPDGHYTFTFTEEPELIKLQSGGYRIALVLVAMPGNIKHKESFVPWEERYEELCKALDVEHGKDIRMDGASFDGDIVHEADRNDVTKSYAHIRNITRATDFGQSANKDEGDCPF